MHRVLKAETSTPSTGTLLEQQARFDAFQRHYNEERPHEALGQTPPAAHWQPSARLLPRQLPEPW
ncbi:MAG: integrase core domain-containing protein [Hyphomicrobiaceae bacterium]